MYLLRAARPAHGAVAVLLACMLRELAVQGGPFSRGSQSSWLLGVVSVSSESAEEERKVVLKDRQHWSPRAAGFVIGRLREMQSVKFTASAPGPNSLTWPVPELRATAGQRKASLASPRQSLRSYA